MSTVSEWTYFFCAAEFDRTPFELVGKEAGACDSRE